MIEREPTKKAFEYIDRSFDRFVAELQAACRQRSISSQSVGMQDMAELVASAMSRVGMMTETVPVDGGFPMVYGELEGHTDRTILFYNHYDVQPPEPLDEWTSDPFAAEIRGEALYARGAADNKGCLMSRIQAIEAIMETEGSLPVTVKFLVEGEEEVGSENLPRFVESNRDLLAADAYVWEYAAKDELGNPTVCLGNKGMCAVELIVVGTETDFHSMMAPIYVNAGWELVRALASLRDKGQGVAIEGFYEGVEPISTDEYEALQKIPVDEEALKKQAGVEDLLLEMGGREAIERLYTAPTSNLCGLEAGYIGEGIKTVLPAKATAKLDFRLVVAQDPEDILEKLRSHLDQHGFEQVRFGKTKKYWPAKTPITAPFVEVVKRTAERVYDRPIVVLPTSAASGPRYVFAGWSGAPIVALGVGHSGSRIHAPDENIRLEDYREGMKHIAAIIYEYGSNADGELEP